MKPFCCKIGCQKEAEWDIEQEKGTDLPTQACTDHVGELLMDGANWVTPIEKEVEAP